ncbi:YegP family protein [Gymnodinialimonas sp.]
MASYRFEIFKSSANNQYYWRFKAPNNEPMCQSEGYINKSGAEHAISVIKREAASARVEDLTMASNALRF